jgi:hypothetical protein
LQLNNPGTPGKARLIPVGRPYEPEVIAEWQRYLAFVGK